MSPALAVEAFAVLSKLRRDFRLDNRRFASEYLRLTKGPIIDWLLERGLVEERVRSLAGRILVGGDSSAHNSRREPMLFVTRDGEDFLRNRNGARS